MDVVCDGGENRHQTTIPLCVGEPLKDWFNPEFDSVIPGICAITAGGDTWVVCPRRLLAFKNDAEANVPSAVNRALQPHERELLTSAGLPVDVDIGI